LEALLTFPIVIDDNAAESLTFVNNVRNAKMSDIKEAEISGKLDAVIVSLEQLLRLIVEENDQTELINILKQLHNMKARYDEQVSAVDRENTRIETVHKVIKTLSTKHNRTISDRQKNQHLLSVLLI